MIRALPVLMLTLLLAASAQAQSADPAATALAVEPGEKVIVTRVTSHERLRGRLVRIDDDGLELANGATRHVVPLGDLERVERPKDRIWNGALIGYGLGFATGAIMVLSDGCDPPKPGALIHLCFGGPGFAVAVGGLVNGPIGFGIGAIGDAIARKPRVVFDRKSRARVAIAPAFARRGAGVRVAVVF
jgi:hypothetical protein